MVDQLSLTSTSKTTLKLFFVDMSNSGLVYKLTVYRKLLFEIFTLHMLKLRFINRERKEIIWKADPLEIERTYNIRKQQTLFY